MYIRSYNTAYLCNIMTTQTKVPSIASGLYFVSRLELLLLSQPGIIVSWELTQVSISEGNSGEIRMADLCILVEDVREGVDRDVVFTITSMDGTAGKIHVD